MFKGVTAIMMLVGTCMSPIHSPSSKFDVNEAGKRGAYLVIEDTVWTHN